MALKISLNEGLGGRLRAAAGSSSELRATPRSCADQHVQLVCTISFGET